jgi:hypothetical protein
MVNQMMQMGFDAVRPCYLIRHRLDVYQIGRMLAGHILFLPMS